MSAINEWNIDGLICLKIMYLRGGPS